MKQKLISTLESVSKAMLFSSKLIKKQTLLCYILFDIKPALLEPDLLIFYEKVCHKKIKLLSSSFFLKVKKTDSYFTPEKNPIVTYVMKTHDLHRLEKAVSMRLLDLISHRPFDKNTIIWRLKPRFIKHENEYRCFFRCGFDT